MIFGVVIVNINFSHKKMYPMLKTKNCFSKLSFEVFMMFNIRHYSFNAQTIKTKLENTINFLKFRAKDIPSKYNLANCTSFALHLFKKLLFETKFQLPLKEGEGQKLRNLQSGSHFSSFQFHHLSFKQFNFDDPFENLKK